MATGLASFFVDIGIHGDTLTLKDMVNKMSDLKIESLAQLEVLDRLKNSFKDVFSASIRHGTELESMKELFNLDPQAVQAWERVAFILSGSSTGADSTLRGVQDVLSNRTTADASAAFYQGAGNLGLGDLSGVTKATDFMAILLSKIPETIKSLEHGGLGRGPMTPENAKGFVETQLEKMRITNDTVLRALFGGPSKFTEMAGRYGGMSNADVQKWDLLNQDMNTLLGQWKDFIRQFEESSLPTVLKAGKTILQDLSDLRHGKVSLSQGLISGLAGANAGYLTWSGLAGLSGLLAGAGLAPLSGGLSLVAASGVATAITAGMIHSLRSQDTGPREITHHVHLDVHGGDEHTLRTTAKKMSEYMMSDFSDFIQTNTSNTARRTLRGEGF